MIEIVVRIQIDQYLQLNIVRNVLEHFHIELLFGRCLTLGNAQRGRQLIHLVPQFGRLILKCEHDVAQAFGCFQVIVGRPLLRVRLELDAEIVREQRLPGQNPCLRCVRIMRLSLLRLIYQVALLGLRIHGVFVAMHLPARCLDAHTFGLCHIFDRHRGPYRMR